MDEDVIQSVLVKDRSEGDFMVGREIENTPAKNMQTLFLPQLYPLQFIQNIKPQHCTHLYFGANKCFPAEITDKDFKKWEITISMFLKKGYWCTLDFQPQHWNMVINSRLTQFPRFIPLVALELPNIQQAGYNACVKLDDTDIEGKNGGVWVHEIHALRSRESFTRWDQYKGDKHYKFDKKNVDPGKRIYKKEEALYD